MAKLALGRRGSGRRIALAGLGILLSLAFVSMAVWASPSWARPLQSPTFDASAPARIIRAGHDVNAAPSVPRFALVVSLVGPADAKGEIYSFKVSLDQNPPTTGRDGQPVRKQTFALNEIRSWRITIVSGELLGSEFQVQANDQLEIRVTDDFGPLNGLAEGDFMLVEEVPVRLPPQSIY